MTNDVASAIAILQRGCLGATGASCYWSERYELALDDLLRKPSRIGNPRYLVRNAMSNARKRMEVRKQIAVFDPLDASRFSWQEDDEVGGRRLTVTSTDEVEYTRIYIADCVSRAPLSTRNRQVLNLLLSGGDAEDLAHHSGIPMKQARVDVSRARRGGRAAWAAA